MSTKTNPLSGIGSRQRRVLDELARLYVRHAGIWVLTGTFCLDDEQFVSEATGQAIRSLIKRGLVDRNSVVIKGSRRSLARINPAVIPVLGDGQQEKLDDETGVILSQIYRLQNRLNVIRAITGHSPVPEPDDTWPINALDHKNGIIFRTPQGEHHD